MEPTPPWIGPELRSRLGPGPRRSVWPAVSMIVATRDGRALLERLVAGLSTCTDYTPFEVVVVDNGSSDDTGTWLRRSAPGFPLTMLEMGRNLSFSAACNRGAAAATHDLLLFVNNDVEPIEPAWLRRLVTTLDDTAAALVGAILVDPALESERGRRGAVHHRDLVFRRARQHAGVLEPRPRGFGMDVADALGADHAAAAVTAACALVRRGPFESVGGFCEQFVYGKEDVDLCLKLAAAGHGIAASGSTVLLHRRGTTRAASVEGAAPTQQANLRLLLERWGPRIRREHALNRDGVWTDDEPSGESGAAISYCVAARRPDHGGDADALARGLAAAARPSQRATEGLVDLMADVMIHVDSTREPPLPWPGRSHALVRLGGPRPSKRLLVRYDVVAKDGRDAARLAAHTEQRLAAAGGPHRVTGPPVATLGGRAIFVLGMSRTGTSTTTRLLGLCGAEVGPDERLMQPNADVNAKGFYEHVPLMRINVELLRRMGGSWREPPVLLPGWELDPRFDDLRGEAHRLMAADFAHADTWVFKDPRTALTLPFWRPLVGPIDFVVCHRHPLDVAASLAQRDAVPLEESLRLWTRYCAAAIANTAGTRRIFVGYDEYFDDRDGVLGALTRFAGSPRLAEDPSFRRRAGEWIDADLRHHRSAHSDLVRDPNIGNGVLSLHLLLELAVRSRSREPALAGERGVGAISDALDELAGQITLASDGGRAAC